MRGYRHGFGGQLILSRGDDWNGKSWPFLNVFALRLRRYVISARAAIRVATKTTGRDPVVISGFSTGGEFRGFPQGNRFSVFV